MINLKAMSREKDPQAKIIHLLAVGLGQYGADTIADTDTHSGGWAALQALTDVVFNAVTESSATGTLAGVTLKQGSVLVGTFTSIKLTSGTLRATRRS